MPPSMSPGEFAGGDGLVDIHCHALPGVDDGAASVAMGLDMLRRAADEGVDDVVLTPHYRPEDGPDRAQQLQDYFEGFAVDVADAGIGVRVHLGAELGFRFGLAQLAQSVTVARLAGGPYVLVDLPPGPLSPGLGQAFFEIRMAGYRPVLAHPERHRELAAAADRIEQLRAQDLLLQIDAGSLRGRFGRRAQAAAIFLAESGQAALVGSDGHDLEKRPLSLRSAYEQMVGLTGAEEAQRLFARNPLLCIDGKTGRNGASQCGQGTSRYVVLAASAARLDQSRERHGSEYGREKNHRHQCAGYSRTSCHVAGAGSVALRVRHLPEQGRREPDQRQEHHGCHDAGRGKGRPCAAGSRGVRRGGRPGSVGRTAGQRFRRPDLIEFA